MIISIVIFTHSPTLKIPSEPIYANSPETKCSAFQINLDKTAIKMKEWKYFSVHWIPNSLRAAAMNVDGLRHIRSIGIRVSTTLIGHKRARASQSQFGKQSAVKRHLTTCCSGERV